MKPRSPWNDSRHLALLVSGVLFFFVTDTVTTHAVLTTGHASESNPIVAHYIDQSGVVGLIFIKSIATTLIIGLDVALWDGLVVGQRASPMDDLCGYVGEYLVPLTLIGIGGAATINNLAVYHHVAVTKGVDPYGIAPYLTVLV